MTEAGKRQAVLAVAAKYVGVKENPAGSNNVFFNTLFYGVEVKDGFDLKGKPNANAKYPWCGTSVSEVFQEALLPLGTIDYRRGFAGCPYAIANLTKWGKEVSFADVQPGDIAFIDFNLDGKWDHVTIVNDKSLAHVNFGTYEGNTSDKGSQSNGGEFMKKLRAYTPAGVKFVRPNVYNL